MILFLTACQTHFPIVSESDQTEKKNYCKENKPLTQINFLFYANTMIDSLTQAKAIQEKTNAGRIRLYINPINNESGKSIDMGSIDEEILNLSFKEKFIRDKGKIKIAYEFKTLNYRTAQFINGIHGYGDVSIVNDYIDELDLPEVLTIQKNDGVKI